MPLRVCMLYLSFSCVKALMRRALAASREAMRFSCGQRRRELGPGDEKGVSLGLCAPVRRTAREEGGLEEMWGWPGVRKALRLWSSRRVGIGVSLSSGAMASVCLPNITTTTPASNTTQSSSSGVLCSHPRPRVCMTHRGHSCRSVCTVSSWSKAWPYSLASERKRVQPWVK